MKIVNDAGAGWGAGATGKPLAQIVPDGFHTQTRRIADSKKGRLFGLPLITIQGPKISFLETGR